MFNERGALWLAVKGRGPSGWLSIGGGFRLVVDGEEILGLAPNGGTLLLTWDGRRILRMARTGHLRRTIDWGASSLPDALRMLWTNSKDNGQRFSLRMERPQESWKAVSEKKDHRTVFVTSS